MTATDKLRKLLEERGVEYDTLDGMMKNTIWCVGVFMYYYSEDILGATELTAAKINDLTPEQAIAATLGDDDYERKMDALLCRLTNGKFSKSRQYDLDFMESCVNEEFEKLYEDELADAALGSDERYDAGFAVGVKATLHQLDGLIHEGADLDEIQGWIDNQWEERS